MDKMIKHHVGCPRCGLLKEVFVLKKYKNSIIRYINSDGKKTVGNVCADCLLKRPHRVSSELSEKHLSKIRNKTKKKCTKCGKLIDVLFCGFGFKSSGIRFPIYEYFDGSLNQLGSKKTMNYRVCYDCDIKIKRDRLGWTKRAESKDPKVIRSVFIEKVAERLFESIGFSVKRCDKYGPDLICEKENLKITVEVKPAIKNKKYNSFTVPSVYKTRINDDLIAIVSPNNKVYIDSMKNHLSYCRASGSRNVTELFKYSN